MAATISSSGTWTALPGLVAMDARANVPSFNKLDLEDLKSRDGVVQDELRQFVQLAADAYGVNFWVAAGVVEILLKALMNSDAAAGLSTYTP